MDIEEKIKVVREQKRIKQIEVANDLGLDPTYYAELEKSVTIEQLKVVAAALGLKWSELLGIDMQTAYNERIEELENEIKNKNLLINQLMYKLSIANNFD